MKAPKYASFLNLEMSNFSRNSCFPGFDVWLFSSFCTLAHCSFLFLQQVFKSKQKQKHYSVLKLHFSSKLVTNMAVHTLSRNPQLKLRGTVVRVKTASRKKKEISSVHIAGVSFLDSPGAGVLFTLWQGEFRRLYQHLVRRQYIAAFQNTRQDFLKEVLRRRKSPFRSFFRFHRTHEPFSGLKEDGFGGWF